jgi:hypothetical protein
MPPVLALETRWLVACTEEKRSYDEWKAIHDNLPPNVRSGFPKIPADGAGGLFLLHQRGKAISLRELREFNKACIVDAQFAWGNIRRETGATIQSELTSGFRAVRISSSTARITAFHTRWPSTSPSSSSASTRLAAISGACSAPYSFNRMLAVR